jgi:hypothetical protein
MLTHIPAPQPSSHRFDSGYRPTTNPAPSPTPVPRLNKGRASNKRKMGPSQRHRAPRGCGQPALQGTQPAVGPGAQLVWPNAPRVYQPQPYDGQLPRLRPSPPALSGSRSRGESQKTSRDHRHGLAPQLGGGRSSFRTPSTACTSCGSSTGGSETLFTSDGAPPYYRGSTSSHERRDEAPSYQTGSAPSFAHVGYGSVANEAPNPYYQPWQGDGQHMTQAYDPNALYHGFPNNGYVGAQQLGNHNVPVMVPSSAFASRLSSAAWSHGPYLPKAPNTTSSDFGIPRQASHLTHNLNGLPVSGFNGDGLSSQSNGRNVSTSGPPSVQGLPIGTRNDDCVGHSQPHFGAGTGQPAPIPDTAPAVGGPFHSGQQIMGFPPSQPGYDGQPHNPPSAFNATYGSYAYGSDNSHYPHGQGHNNGLTLSQFFTLGTVAAGSFGDHRPSTLQFNIDGQNVESNPADPIPYRTSLTGRGHNELTSSETTPAPESPLTANAGRRSNSPPLSSHGRAPSSQYMSHGQLVRVRLPPAEN